MTTNNAGIFIIKKWESCKLTAYLCPAGRWTIGWGHTGNVQEGDKITLAQAETLLRMDLVSREKWLTMLNLKISENQFSALLSLIYNIGQGNFLKSPVYKLVQVNPNEPAIKQAFLRHIYYKDKKTGQYVKASGLEKRRLEEIELYFS
jgi:lysozyme